jgi:hypothetical protein
VSASERKRELRRRRHRKKKYSQLSRKLKTATVSEKAVITDKVRCLTPGCEVLLANWGLGKRR